MKISNSKLRTVITAVLSLGMVAYLVVAFALTDMAARASVCRGITIEIVDDAQRNFVTSREIARELGDFTHRAPGMRMADINTDKVARKLRSIDKIESVEVLKTTDNKIYIRVIPLVPVARIFDDNESYYVNKDGKRITANARYHIDVPVIQGHFPMGDSVMNPLQLMPLLEWLEGHSKWNQLVTMLKVKSPHDILLIPAIDGHVVNIGDVNDLDSKFSRLGKVYTSIMPVKGWRYYDTISVKWGGQIVATRRDKPVEQSQVSVDDDVDDADVTTMLAAEGVAPGRTRPGQKAHSEKPIPAAVSEKADTAKTSQPSKSDKPN